MKKQKDRGCKAFPYRLTCDGKMTWHEIKESAIGYAESRGLKECHIDLWQEDGEYKEVE
jgi:hypothetical protein